MKLLVHSVSKKHHQILEDGDNIWVNNKCSKSIVINLELIILGFASNNQLSIVDYEHAQESNHNADESCVEDYWSKQYGYKDEKNHQEGAGEQEPAHFCHISFGPESIRCQGKEHHHGSDRCYNNHCWVILNGDSSDQITVEYGVCTQENVVLWHTSALLVEASHAYHEANDDNQTEVIQPKVAHDQLDWVSKSIVHD